MRSLMSTASTWKRSAGTPASSNAMAMEYGSSPLEQGTLSTRNWRASAPGAKRRSRASAAIASWDSGYRKNHVSGTITASISCCISAGEVCRRIR
ncbi:Uncharacterised protein [Achromobacter xylosoxidans]|nr:Uncharacterised protein [Achromobacter xylosoxidans]CUJ19367.1 Uncharacterised protein [Achromobacter xylosoxidans]